MIYDVLDEKRKELLPSFAKFKDRFYLAGGTGLALQLGHQVSIDFDFFTPDHIDTRALFEELRETYGDRDIKKTLEEPDSLEVVIDGEIKISFLRYAYPLVEPCIEEGSLRIASIEDIACMKLSAIVSRAVEKDYVDIYCILKNIPLARILAHAAQKMPHLDQNLITKSLLYFTDVTEDAIAYKPGWEVSFDEVKHSLGNAVRSLPGYHP